jgi:hypothetical protein
LDHSGVSFAGRLSPLCPRSREARARAWEPNYPHRGSVRARPRLGGLGAAILLLARAPAAGPPGRPVAPGRCAAPSPPRGPRMGPVVPLARAAGRPAAAPGPLICQCKLRLIWQWPGLRPLCADKGPRVRVPGGLAKRRRARCALFTHGPPQLKGFGISSGVTLILDNRGNGHSPRKHDN